MTHSSNRRSGSKTLLMLGVAAAVLGNRHLRERLLDAAYGLSETAHEVYEDRVAPAASVAFERAQEAAQHAAEYGREVYGQVSEAAAERAEDARHGLGDLVGSAEHTAAELRKQAAKRAQNAEKAATKTAADLRKHANTTVEQAERGIFSFLQGAQDTAHDLGKDARRGVKRTEGSVFGLLKDAEGTAEDLRQQAAQRGKESARELKRHKQEAEHAAAEWKRDAERRLKAEAKQRRKETEAWRVEADRRGRELGHLPYDVLEHHDRGGSVGWAIWVGAGLLIGTLAVLVRVPKARAAVIEKVEAVNPEAAQSLRELGDNAQHLMGAVWIEKEPGGESGPGAHSGGSPREDRRQRTEVVPTPDKDGGVPHKD